MITKTSVFSGTYTLPALDIADATRGYDGKWVIIAGDGSRVLYQGDSMREVLDLSATDPDSRAIIFKVPGKDSLGWW
jgi:hypothetical protein